MMEQARDTKRICLVLDAGDGIEVDGPATIMIEHKSGRRARLSVDRGAEVRVTRVKPGGMKASGD